MSWSGCATSSASQDEVELAGAEDSDAVVADLHQATVFALTPRELADGDRDGIPNVLVEAMACGLPVVTTTAGGITELVEHDLNGLLPRPVTSPGSPTRWPGS